jgi:hypothetical protein
MVNVLVIRSKIRYGNGKHGDDGERSRASR